MSTIREPAKDVLVARDVDVVVAGAGVCGVFAALAAAREGVKVVLVERFGTLGGNIGAQGYVIGGPTGIPRPGADPRPRGPQTLAPIPKELVARALALMDGLPRKNYPEIVHAYSRVATQMAEEAGVELMMSAYAADPIMEGNCVRGLFVETPGGRVAVRAKVVIDATGDAAIALRAGAPVIARQDAAPMKSPNLMDVKVKPEYAHWNEGGIYYLITGADIPEFREWYDGPEQPELTPEDAAWQKAYLGLVTGGGVWNRNVVAPILRQGAESGEFDVLKKVRPRLHIDFTLWFDQLGPDLSCGRCEVHGEWDTGNWEDVSLAETQVRAHAYDGVRFLRRHVPGFQDASIIAMSPFLGARGGPHIEGEYVLTPQESFAGMRHPDTMFVSFSEVHRGGAASGHDVPYGMILPKKVDGLLVTGRGASWRRRGHDPSFRYRTQIMGFGQAAGLAAALAVKDQVAPRQLSVRRLQKALLNAGFYLGDADRLRELGIA